MSQEQVIQIIAEIARLRQENEKLKDEVAYLRFELEQARAKRYKSDKEPPSDLGEGQTEAPKKKKGAKFGHIGWFRKKPDKIDRVEDVRLDYCPHCGSKDIQECKNVDEHIQEDIVLPRVEAVMYRHHEYYCPECRKKSVAGVGPGEMPNSYIGPKAKALAVFLKYSVKVSERDIQALFEKAFNLKIVNASISGFRFQLKRAGGPLYRALIESLKNGLFIHADETGWKVDGLKRWLWKFSNKKVSVSHIDSSRGQKVLEEILGEKYLGTLISDFLSAYNKILTKAKQRCLAHILRDLKKVREYWHDDAEVMTYIVRLAQILDEAMSLHKEYKDKDWDDAYNKRRELLKASLNDFAFPNPNKRILNRFSKRLQRHKNELLTFLYEKDVDYHNNHAEQQIRPDVILRKITNGNRSEKGAEYHSVISSILQTAKLNKIDPIGTFESLLLGEKQYSLLTALSPP